MSLVRVKSSVLYQRPKWAGFSLVDLLISLFLGVILSWTAAEVYLASVRSYLLKVEMANIQNNGRFALAVLRRELMQVGFLGGASTLSPLQPKAVSRDCVTSGAWALDAAIPMDFESQQFSIPNQFSKILSDLYGDYTQLPEEQDRTSSHMDYSQIKIRPYGENCVNLRNYL